VYSITANNIEIPPPLPLPSLPLKENPDSGPTKYLNLAQLNEGKKALELYLKGIGEDKKKQRF
jgi:hypothetical protein